jgi:hypothetical protein
MAWNEAPETYANLGWVGEGEGTPRSDDLVIARDLVIEKLKSHHRSTLMTLIQD